MRFKAKVELYFEADSASDAEEHVANMMEELQDNHAHVETGDPWLEDWYSVRDTEQVWIQRA